MVRKMQSAEKDSSSSSLSPLSSCPSCSTFFLLAYFPLQRQNAQDEVTCQNWKSVYLMTGNWMSRSISSVQHLVASFLLCHAMVTGIAYWHGACVIAQVSPSLPSKPPILSWRPQFMTSSNPIYFEKGPPSHDINTWFWGVSYCLDFVFLFPNLTTTRII